MAGGNSISAMTNDAGAYAAILPAGGYRVTIESAAPPGDGPTPGQILVKADQHLSVDFLTHFYAA
jgi:hypothetical protein